MINSSVGNHAGRQRREQTMNVPPVPDGHMRLWRGVPSRPKGDVGEYFSLYRHIAEEYASYTLDEEPAKHSSLFYIDIPAEQTVQWRAQGRTKNEYHLPREVANKARLVK